MRAKANTALCFQDFVLHFKTCLLLSSNDSFKVRDLLVQQASETSTESYDVHGDSYRVGYGEHEPDSSTKLGSQAPGYHVVNTPGLQHWS